MCYKLTNIEQQEGNSRIGPMRHNRIWYD